MRIRTGWRRLCRRPGAREALAAAALFALAAVTGMVYQASWGGHPLFWQNTTFTQGLMWVCGRGYVNPMVAEVPGLAEFLDSQTDCFDCAAIPAHVRVLPPDTTNMSFEEIDAYHPQPNFPGFIPLQRYHLYLVWAVTLCWWVFGVCWSALTPLAGLLYGASVASAYGLFRAGMRRWLAVPAALLLMVSPLHLQLLPHLRDYSKAPFILFTLMLLAWLVRRRMGFWPTLGLAALGGAAAGVGMGFRTDTGIVVPAFVAVLLFFLPGRPRATWPQRLLGPVVFVGAFCATGWPIILAAFEDAGHFAHVALLGYLPYCSARLGVDAPLYSLGGPYSDYFIANVVQGFVQRLGQEMPPTQVMMPAYHEAANQYLAAYVHAFPADVLLRAYTAVLRVLDELHANPAAPWPAGITNEFLRTLFNWRAAVVDTALAGGRYAAALALTLLAARRLRWAFAGLFLLLFFTGYPSLQFNTRHVFHMAFLNLWILGFLACAAVWVSAYLWRARAEGLDRRAFQRGAVRVAVFWAITVAGLWAPLQGLRWYQDTRVKMLAEEMLACEREPLTLAMQAGADGGLHAALPAFDRLQEDTGPDAPPVRCEMLALELRHTDVPLPITFLYTAENREHYDYTWTVTAPPRDAGAPPAWVFVPVYMNADNRFVGLRMPNLDMPSTCTAYRVSGGQDIPLWLAWVLPPGWRETAGYQRLTR